MLKWTRDVLGNYTSGPYKIIREPYGTGGWTFYLFLHTDKHKDELFGSGPRLKDAKETAELHAAGNWRMSMASENPELLAKAARLNARWKEVHGNV